MTTSLQATVEDSQKTGDDITGTATVEGNQEKSDGVIRRSRVGRPPSKKARGGNPPVGEQRTRETNEGNGVSHGEDIKDEGPSEGEEVVSGLTKSSGTKKRARPAKSSSSGPPPPRVREKKAAPPSHPPPSLSDGPRPAPARTLRGVTSFDINGKALGDDLSDFFVRLLKDRLILDPKERQKIIETIGEIVRAMMKLLNSAEEAGSKDKSGNVSKISFPILNKNDLRQFMSQLDDYRDKVSGALADIKRVCLNV